jgi:hypothetical protein
MKLTKMANHKFIISTIVLLLLLQCIFASGSGEGKSIYKKVKEAARKMTKTVKDAKENWDRRGQEYKDQRDHQSRYFHSLYYDHNGYKIDRENWK